MNDRSKGFPMVGLRSALAALVLSVSAGGLAMAQGTADGRRGQTAGGPAMVAGMHGMSDGMGHHGGAGLPISDRLLDSVGATADQKTRVREIMSAARADLQSQREAGRSLREQMVKLMTAAQVDAAAIEALRQQQLQRHDAASRRMTQAMIDAGNVLTPQQRQQLGDRLMKMHDMAQRHRTERRALTAPKV